MDNALTPVSASAIRADSSSDRIIELDSIRGLAALSVVLYHYIVRYHELYTHDETLANAGSFLTTVMPYGRFGVEVFFVLSGFVMLMSVSRAKSARDFLIQRAARLCPAFGQRVS